MVIYKPLKTANLAGKDDEVKHLYIGMMAALLVASTACNKQETPSNAPDDAKKAETAKVEKAVQKPADDQKKGDQAAAENPFDGLFIEGRKLNYRLKEKLERAPDDRIGEGWTCPEAGKPGNCVKKSEVTAACSIDQVTKTGEPGSKEYAVQNKITCAPHEQMATDLTHVLAGCWRRTQDGLFYNNECKEFTEKDKIFSFPLKEGSTEPDPNGECSDSEKITHTPDGLWCRTEKNGCGDPYELKTCFADKEGLKSVAFEIAVGIKSRVNIDLLPADAPAKNP